MSEAKMNWRVWDLDAGGQAFEFPGKQPWRDGEGTWWTDDRQSSPRARCVPAPEFDLPEGSEVPDIPVWIGEGPDPRGQWEVRFVDGSVGMFKRPQRLNGGVLESLCLDGAWLNTSTHALSVRFVPWPDEPEGNPDPRDARIAELGAQVEKLKAENAKLKARMAELEAEREGMSGTSKPSGSLLALVQRATEANGGQP